MKKWFRILSACLLVSLFVLGAVFVIAADKTEQPGSASVVYDSSSGVLTVSGAGAVTASQTKKYSKAETLVIEKGVETIGRKAFASFENLKSVTVPSSVRVIDEAAFSGCTALKKIYTGRNTKKIMAYAFYGCKNLSEVFFGTNVRTIGKNAFSACTSLKSLALPDSADNIRERAVGCSGKFGSGKIKGFTLYGVKNSDAESFASANSLKFVPQTEVKASLSFSSAGYNGKAKKPSVTYKTESGETLGAGSFTAAYSAGRKAVGKYYINTYLTDNRYYCKKQLLSFKIVPAKVSSLNAASAEAGKVKITYGASSGGKYYQIYYSKSASSGFKKLKTLTSRSYTATGLTEGATYYFKVRSYKTVNGSKYYSAFTSPVSVKVAVSYKTTSKGYKIEEINGITYVDGIIIANKTYSLPSSYNPGGLTSECSAAFTRMKNAASQQGLNIYVLSGFRSYDTQKNLYNRYVARDGKAAADRYSARPGHSEHQTGLAIDVCSIASSFENTPEGRWLAANCWRYGFILRYPKGKESVTGYMYESWHIRYVGTERSEKIYNSGLTLEEYYGITSVYSN